jgi:hypothetical protein
MKPRDAESRLGDVLLKMGAITEAQLGEVLERQRAGDARPLGLLVLELGFAEPRDVQLAVLRQQALRGHFTCEDGLRLLEEAREGTQRVGRSLSELTSAAQELGGRR